MKKTRESFERMRAVIALNSNLVFWQLQMMLVAMRFTWQECRVVSSRIIEVIRVASDEPHAARLVWSLIGHKAEVIKEELKDRAVQVCSQILPHVDGSRILDFGTGDGKVAELLSLEDFDVVTYDVSDYRINKTLPFHLKWKTLAQQRFDTAVAAVVFHHCDNPELEIVRLAKVANRLVVIESVLSEAMPWWAQYFVDWVYNRGLHPGANIPVPGEFHSVSKWREVFVRHGFEIISEEDLGIDLPIVPEHHWRFTLEKR